MNPSNCTICQTEITQRYCPNCGQEISTSDTTFTSLISDFFSNLFSLEKSVFAGMIKIVTHPKKLVVNYWRGHRRYYPSPGKLLVYTLAIAVLHMTYVNKDLFGLSLDYEGVGSQFMFWMISFPLLVLTSYFSFFRKKLNLAKHIISIGYIASCFFIIGTVINDVLIYFSLDNGPNAFLVFLLFVFIWNARVFISKPNVIKIILFAFLQFFVILVLFAGLVGMLYLIYPDTIRIN